MKRARSGFTLVEMMTVLVVLVILAVISAPAFSSMLARQHLRGHAGEAYADMQLARASAVERNAVVLMSFSGSGWQVTQGTTVLKSVALSNNVAVQSGQGMAISFEPVRGAATISGGPLVLAHPQTGITVSLSVNGLGRPEACTNGTPLGSFEPC